MTRGRRTTAKMETTVSGRHGDAAMQLPVAAMKILRERKRWESKRDLNECR